MNSRTCIAGGPGTGRAIAFWAALAAAATCAVPRASADDAAACAEVSYLKEVAIPACTRLIQSGNLHGVDLARAYSYRGRARLWASNPNDFDPAMADHDEAVRLAPDLSSVYVNRALGWVRLGKREPAGEDVEKAIALDPGNAQAYFTRAEMNRYTPERREQVIADYGKAIALQPDYLDAHFAQATMLSDRDFGRAIDGYSRIIALKPDWQDGTAYQARAAAYAAAGDDRLALADRTEVIRALQNGEHPGAHTGLAAVYRARGDFGRALAEVNAAMRIAPGLAGLLVERASTYLAMGNTAEALVDIDASLRPFPRDPGAHLVKARIYEAMGRKDDAITEFREVRDLLTSATTAYDRRTLADSLGGLDRLGRTP
jgi:tetratricopeptide (TPR) repeat protein